jgi:hypothetical protein
MIKIKNLLNVAAILFLLLNCSGFQANNVKLKDFPEIKKEGLNKMSIDIKLGNYWFTKDDFLKNYEVKKDKESGESKCVVNAFVNSYNRFLTCPLITNYIAPFTLFTIPYYCARHYEAHATLLTKNKNPNSQEKYKILKEYQLSDRVDEVWSLIWMLNPFSWDEKSPEYAKSQTYTRISEAIVRQVLNDAKNFKECQK